MDISEFNKCADEYSNAVYRFLLKSLRDSDTAKDLVQDSFQKLWACHGSIDAAKAKAYLFACAYNAMIDHLRRQKRYSDQMPEDSLEWSEEIKYSGLNEALQSALQRLPDAQRSVVMLRDYEGYSYEEIAHITKLTPSAVKVYIFRARVFLKNFLMKAGICPETYSA